MKKILFILTIFLTYLPNSYAEDVYFIDFSQVLNNSKPGAEAQKKLKVTFENEVKKYKKLETDIRKEESEIITQKKTLSPEDYKKKVVALRKKVSDTQKKKQASFNSITKSRNSARNNLLKSVEPIIKKYMEENKIKLIVKKQSVILGDANLEITNQIIAIINKEVSSLKTN